MTRANLAVFEQALQAPVMDAVIAVTERYQFLEEHQGARVFTAYRAVDHVLHVGFTTDLNQKLRDDLKRRGFALLAEREGTRREHRLLLVTLQEVGHQASYHQDYFAASKGLLRHLRNLGWPLGRLSSLLGKSQGDINSLSF
jgi:hypothetical protein